jgi:peptide/nickel transport system substrate-binding protein
LLPSYPGSVITRTERSVTEPTVVRQFAFSLILLGTACADRPGVTDESQTGGTMIVALPGTGMSPTFPPYSADNMSRMVVDQIYDRLAEIGPGLNVVSDRGYEPRLARRWEWASDSMSIAFHLDPNARWHDGRPIRASDVRFTVNLLKDPRTATQYTEAITNVDSVSVRDSLTAVVWFRARSPEQFYQVVYQVYPLPEHLLKDISRDQLSTSDAAQRPVGSGRFRLSRFEPGVRIELVADTTHYRGRPNLDRILLVFAGDANNAVTQLFNGEADFLDVVPPDVVPRVDSADNLRAVPYPTTGYGFMIFNARDPQRPAAPHPIFGDRAVRRALSMSVDREGMLRNVYGRHGVLGVGPYPKALADTSVKAPTFDRARAGALLDSAGWRAGPDGTRAKNGRPLAFAITVPTTSPSRMRYAVLLQEQLRNIGARVEINAMEFNASQERVTSGRFDATLMTIGQDPPRTGVGQFWATAGKPPAGANFGAYSNSTVDALLDSLAFTTDPARSDAQWRRMSQIIIDDAPAIWLFEFSPVAAVHRRLRVEGLRGDAWWAGVADWWIPANERIDRDRIGLRPAQQ